MKITVDGQSFDVTLAGDEVIVGDRTFRVRTEGRGALKTVFVDEQAFRIEVPVDTGASEMRVLVDAKYHDVHTEADSKLRTAALRPAAARQVAAPKPAAVPGGIPAAMAGRVLRLSVEPGQAVKSGDLLLVFEAMKMENEIRAPHDGTVTAISVKPGDRVNAGDLLVVIL